MRMLALVMITLLPLLLAGCDGTGLPNDVADMQDKARMNRGVPNATDLPPGLSNDLPESTTQPMVQQ